MYLLYHPADGTLLAYYATVLYDRIFCSSLSLSDFDHSHTKVSSVPLCLAPISLKEITQPLATYRREIRTKLACNICIQ